jgi:hypothetical protein
MSRRDGFRFESLGDALAGICRIRKHFIARGWRDTDAESQPSPDGGRSD